MRGMSVYECSIVSGTLRIYERRISVQLEIERNRKLERCSSSTEVVRLRCSCRALRHSQRVKAVRQRQAASVRTSRCREKPVEVSFWYTAKDAHSSFALLAFVWVVVRAMRCWVYRLSRSTRSGMNAVSSSLSAHGASTHAASMPAPPPPEVIMLPLPSTTSLGAWKRLLTMLARFHCSRSCSDLLNHSLSFFCSSCDKLPKISCESSCDDDEDDEEGGAEVDVEAIDGNDSFFVTLGPTIRSRSSLNLRSATRRKYSRKLYDWNDCAVRT